MTDEQMRKLSLIARIEDTLAEVLRDNLERAESREVREHMVRLASSHQWHAKALDGIDGVKVARSEKIDEEMRALRRRVETASEYGDFMDTLSNVEREEEVRLEQLLGEELDQQIIDLLESAHRDIEADYRLFLQEAAALGQA